MFLSAVPGVTRKLGDGSEITKDGHDEVLLIHGAEFADRDMSCLFAERAWHLFLEMGDDYTEYPSLEEQDSVSGYPDSLVASKCAQGSLTPGAVPNFENYPEVVNDDDYWDLNGAIVG